MKIQVTRLNSIIFIICYIVTVMIGGLVFITYMYSWWFLLSWPLAFFGLAGLLQAAYKDWER